MTIYFASDHAGYTLKNTLLAYVRDELGYDVVDCGAFEQNPHDDYVDFVRRACLHVSEHPSENRAIVLGGSGQGEAMCANRFPGVRAGVFYGTLRTQVDADAHELSMIASLRHHNDANVLSIGARFVEEDEAKYAVREWLSLSFTGEERHVRRIEKLG